MLRGFHFILQVMGIQGKVWGGENTHMKKMVLVTWGLPGWTRARGAEAC